MRDTDLYHHLLGLEDPWFVKEVDLDTEAQRVDVWVEHPKGLHWPCPECGAEGRMRPGTFGHPPFLKGGLRGILRGKALFTPHKNTMDSPPIPLKCPVDLRVPWC